MMDIDIIIAGVFAGNVLTAAFLWGCFKCKDITDPGQMSWLNIAALLMPLLFALSVFITADPPQFLGAIVAR